MKDRRYLAFIAEQPCIATGQRPVTVHHVRRFGSPRDDRRTVPLIAQLHMRTHEVPGVPCVERGKRVFEQCWGVDLEAEIRRLNALYKISASRVQRTVAEAGCVPCEPARRETACCTFCEEGNHESPAFDARVCRCGCICHLKEAA